MTEAEGKYRGWRSLAELSSGMSWTPGTPAPAPAPSTMHSQKMTPAEEPLLSSTSDDNQLRFHTSHQQQLQHQRDEESLDETQSLVQEIWLENKKIWQIAGPSSFARVAMFSLTVITQSFAGHLGNRDLAAISIVTTVLISITFGFLVSQSNLTFSFLSFSYLSSDK